MFKKFNYNVMLYTETVDQCIFTIKHCNFYSSGSVLEVFIKAKQWPKTLAGSWRREKPI